MYSQIHTYGECRGSVLKMLERYSSNGTLNSCGEMKDMENGLVESINANMRKLYAEFVRESRKKALIFRAPRVICNFGPLYIEKGTEFTGSFSGKGFCFYAEVCGSGDIVFKSSNGFDSYSFGTDFGETEILKGTPTGATSGEISFTVSASDDVFLYSLVIYDGSHNEFIMPKGYCMARLPEGCAKVLSITDENGFLVSEDIFDISPSDLSVVTGAENSGKYVFEYYAYPDELAENCNDDAEIKLPGVLFDALCYMCAADLCPSSDGGLYSKLAYKYREILENYYDGARSHESERNSFYRLCGRICRKSNISCARKQKKEG